MKKRRKKGCLGLLLAGILLLVGCQNGSGGKPELVKESGPESVDSPVKEPGPESVDSPVKEPEPEAVNSPVKEPEPEAVNSSVKEPEPEAVDIPVDDYLTWNELFEENACSEEFMQALAEFSYQSASQVLAQEEGNGNFSPLSLYYALALAACGAEEETSGELLQVLGMEDKEDLALACKKLYQQLYYREQQQRGVYQAYGEGEFQSALRLRNSLWLSPAFSFHPEYQDRAASDFYASIHPADFQLADTGKAMGQWISDQTNGVLAPEIAVDPNTALCILNTLYFYGGWDTKFSKERTKTEEFTLADQTKISCPMMNRTEEFGVFQKGDGYTMACLNTNNHCRMVILLPDRDRTVEEFLQDKVQLKESLGAVETMDDGSWQNGKIIWKVPKFSFGSSYPLEGILQRMGIQKMFDREQADFSGISPDKPLWVSKVIQESHLGIDEEGVEGAAYTMLAVCGAGMPEEREEAEMFCDRPFLYGIQDRYSGAWLFIGVCRNPEAG